MASSSTGEESSLDSQRFQILHAYIDQAIPNHPHQKTRTDFIPEADVKDTLDLAWHLLQLRIQSGSARDSTETDSSHSYSPQALQKLCTQLATRYNILPSTFFLKDVRYTSYGVTDTGGYAEIRKGTWNNQVVALKSLRGQRVSSDAQETEDERRAREIFHRDFCRESILWCTLEHAHILPFLGVSADDSGRICMVLPWMKSNNIRKYTYHVLRKDSQVSGVEHILTLHTWLHEVASGLSYLHSNKVVHGDIHGGNILVDDEGHARITDFGLGVISGATSGNYGSVHGGGAVVYRAPELHKPELFGCKDSRPTVASDIYAFAFLCIELYTDSVPTLHDDAGHQINEYYPICEGVVYGRRPQRPKTLDGVEMPDHMWNLTESCWKPMPKERPEARTVLERMDTILSMVEPNIVTTFVAPSSNPSPVRTLARDDGGDLSNSTANAGPESVEKPEQPPTDESVCGCCCVIS